MCRYLNHKRISERGFSLMELIIVVAIIGIVSSIAGINFNQWLVKSRVEAQVNQMVNDISELRIRALTTKQRHSVTFDAKSYIFKSYSSEYQPKDYGNLISGGTHNVEFGLKDKAGSAYSNFVLVIDGRGMLESGAATVILDYGGSAAVDCFTLHTVRVNPGRKNAAGDCDDK